MATRIPGPPGHPILGNLNEMRQDFLQFLVTTSQRYGPVAQIRAGPSRMILLTAPDDIAEVLVKRSDVFHKTGSTRRLLAPLLGDGLITLEHEDHKRHRRIMQPAFHSRQIQTYTGVVTGHTQAWINQRKPEETLDIVPAFASLMLEIVVATFFSASLNETEAMRTALRAFSQALDLRVRSPIPLPRWLPTEHNRVLNHALTTLDTAIYRLITERQQQPEMPDDLLSSLLNARDETTGQPLSAQEIRDELATIFFAGYETTTTTLAWVWYLLATHPAILERLHEEIRQVTGGDLPRSEHTVTMPYLDQVLKEVLRLYPAAWLFDREPVETVNLGGYPVAAGQTIFISPYLVHRSPTYFDDPDVFRPERFAGDLEKSLPRFAYFPFGGGPRICIGQTFALHTLRLMLATIIPRLSFELLPGQTIRPAAAATLVPAQGVRMRVRSSVLKVAP